MCYTYNVACSITDAPNSCFIYDTNNRLTTFNGNAVSYDMDGNMLSNGYINCEFDSGNRLISADGLTYTYNAEDVRIRNLCSDADTTYTYNTNCKLSQLLQKTTNGITTKYVYGLGLIGEEKEGCFKTYHFDYRGSTVAITDECGNIIDTLKYDTYGNVTEHIGDSFVIFGYNGRDGVITDRNGLLYMRARYYSPAIRRFINADILHGEISDSTSLNRYSYVNGNPVSFVDPFGLVAERGTTSLNAKSNFSAKSEAIDDLLSKIEERKKLEALWDTIEFIESQKAIGIHHNLSRYTYWDLGVDTDIDGKIDYYVYNYFYKKSYKNLNATTFDIVSGKVYFYVNVDVSFFENPNNKPEGFNSRNDVMIGDFTTSENPTLYAYQAHNINSDVIDSIVDVMMLYDKDFNTAWDRTKDSIIVEWKNHNLYSSFDKSAQDIDFDNAEEGYNSVDYAMKAIKRFLERLFS